MKNHVTVGRCAAGFLLLMLLAACSTPPLAVSPPDDQSLEGRLTTLSMTEVAADLAAGKLSSAEVVSGYLARIEAVDRKGPRLRSVLSINPNAMADARRLDELRSAGENLGPLHGVPVLIKDNIESLDPLATTAGALALKENFATTDAPLVASLRSAGAVILGKTNLSQWANFRSSDSVSGWSALGGQVRNPHVLDRSPCGSSSGSGAAMAASLAAGTIGTETNGSVICPAAMNGVVGFKPTVGLVSQSGIVPISFTQDTAGPLTRTVRDAALLYDVMSQESRKTSAVESLGDDALSGLRVGVLRFATAGNNEIETLFDDALRTLSDAGSTLVEIKEYEVSDQVWEAEYKILLVEFKASLNAYLAATPTSVTTRTLADVMAFNQAHADVEMALFDQGIFAHSNAQAGVDDPEYLEAKRRVRTATRDQGIDQFLSDYDVDILVAPTLSPAFLIDPVHGDSYDGSVGIGWMAAMSGYPHLTVPMGVIHDLPVGVSFFGTGGTDARVLAIGHAYEMRSQKRATPRYLPSADASPSIRRALGGTDQN